MLTLILTYSLVPGNNFDHVHEFHFLYLFCCWENLAHKNVKGLSSACVLIGAKHFSEKK